MQKLKLLLKDDKNEAHTFWTLTALLILCGIFLFSYIKIEKEETVTKALVHMQISEILGGLLNKHTEVHVEFQILIHQILGHLAMCDPAEKSFYIQDDLFMSLNPLLDSENYGVVHTALSIIAILLMSVFLRIFYLLI